MADWHKVKKDETLFSIAGQYDFLSYETLYNDPLNAAPRSKRSNPDILFPGDEIYIPEFEVASFPRDPDHHLQKFVHVRDIKNGAPSSLFYSQYGYANTTDSRCRRS
jgi:hypothetical protein